MEHGNSGSTRRGFIKGAGITMLGAATSGLGLQQAFADSGSASVSATSASVAGSDSEWDATYDVVIVGAGLAGCTAAVTIATEGTGQSVLLVEKGADGPKGNSSVSLGVSHRTDDVETFKKYITALMGDRSTTPQDVIDAYCEGVGENLDWIKSLDPDVDAMYITEPGGKNAEGVGGEYPELEGSESIAWFGLGCNDELAGAADDGGSPHLPQFLLQKVQEYSDVITYQTNTALTELVQDPETRGVLGVILDGKTRVKANKGVIMAIGGFECNAKMREDYFGQGGAVPCLDGGNTGDGFAICEKAGADFWHMHCAGMWMAPRDLANTRYTVSPLAIPFPKENGITVSTGGRRFYMDWDGYRANNNDDLMSDIRLNVGNRHGLENFGGQWTALPFPPTAWFIFDANGLAAGALDDDDPVGNGLCYSADTIEDLAAQIDAPTDELVKTVDTWNTFCEGGEDLAFYRPSSKMSPIDTPPYYAQLVVPSFMNTMGGPVRSAKGEILDPDGNPIPNLYSAGEFGSIWGHYYNGGGNISECLVFGRISARSILEA